MNDVDSHVFKDVDEFGLIQSFGNVGCLLLCLLGDVVEAVFYVVMAGECLVAGKGLERIGARVPLDGFEIIVSR